MVKTDSLSARNKALGSISRGWPFCCLAAAWLPCSQIHQSKQAPKPQFDKRTGFRLTPAGMTGNQWVTGRTNLPCWTVRGPLSAMAPARRTLVSVSKKSTGHRAAIPLAFLPSSILAWRAPSWRSCSRLGQPSSRGRTCSSSPESCVAAKGLCLGVPSPSGRRGTSHQETPDQSLSRQ